MPNIVEFEAGSGITLSADAANKTINFTPSTNLTDAQKAALENSNASAANKFMTESEVDTKIANNPGGGNPNPLTENQIAALNVPTASASNKFTTQSDVTGAIAPIKNTYKYFIKVFTSSGSYTVLEKGLYEIRLCGGGAPGTPGFMRDNTERMGSGGMSGELQTWQGIIDAGTAISYTIGAAGKGSENGGNTIINFNDIKITAAGGRRRTDLDYPHVNEQSSIIYDGLSGHVPGGVGACLTLIDTNDWVVGVSGLAAGDGAASQGNYQIDNNSGSVPGSGAGGPIPILYDSDGNKHEPADNGYGGRGFGAGGNGGRTSNSAGNGSSGVVILRLLELR